jgi:hypothetical protein
LIERRQLTWTQNYFLKHCDDTPAVSDDEHETVTEAITTLGEFVQVRRTEWERQDAEEEAKRDREAQAKEDAKKERAAALKRASAALMLGDEWADGNDGQAEADSVTEGTHRLDEAERMLGELDGHLAEVRKKVRQEPAGAKAVEKRKDRKETGGKVRRSRTVERNY